MHQFRVQDMTCAHCAQTVAKALKSVDADAGVSIDLATKSVEVESQASAETLLGAIRDAGYDGAQAAACCGSCSAAA